MYRENTKQSGIPPSSRSHVSFDKISVVALSRVGVTFESIINSPLSTYFMVFTMGESHFIFVAGIKIDEIHLEIMYPVDIPNPNQAVWVMVIRQTIEQCKV
jgi:hypothetical protein